MPAAKLFLNSSDIAAVMGFSIRSAQNMLSMFEMRGQTVKSGRTSRGQLVSLTVFVRYLCEQDGEDPVERSREIKEYLRESNHVHTKKDIKEEGKR